MPDATNNPALPPAQPFRRALAEWFARSRRPLPWRLRPSLYRTVVSEFMLQQTQVKTMLPHFERWMERFPDFATLARADETEVLKCWEGLGYYNRARNLHKLAREYVALRETPRTAEAWRALPGIGPYTAAAVASIVFGEPVAVVDGNVVRILARITGDRRTFPNNAAAVKAFTQTAGALLDPAHPGTHNEAMMELGATVCLKRRPLCTVCPVVRFCAAAARGEPDAYPRIQRKATESVAVDRLWIVRRGKLLLRRIPDQAGQLAGQHELPRPGDLGRPAPEDAPLATRVRAITHRRITERIHRGPPDATARRRHLVWVPLRELDRITLSGPHRRWISELLTDLDRP